MRAFSLEFVCPLALALPIVPLAPGVIGGLPRQSDLLYQSPQAAKSGEVRTGYYLCLLRYQFAQLIDGKKIVVAATAVAEIRVYNSSAAFADVALK